MNRKEERSMSKSRKNRKKKPFLWILSILLLLLIFVFVVYLFLPKEFKEKLNLPEELPTATPEPDFDVVSRYSKERAFAVMIDNNIGNNKHAGLQDAYIVYEIIVEGGLTRLMALYKDVNTELIGPIRSSRHYYLDYALENGAVYAHYGWSEFAKNDIATLGVENLNGMTNASDAFWRDRKIAAPHNVFTNIETLKESATKRGYSLTSNQELLLNYQLEEVSLDAREDKIVANKVVIPYSNYINTSYVYDAENKVYLRSMNGKAHVDKVTGKQYTAKNIIVEKVSNYSLDREGRQDIRNIGEYDGYYITNGYAVPIKCKKEKRSSQTVYTYLDGTEIDVNDGNTFIQIQPANRNTTIE